MPEKPTKLKVPSRPKRDALRLGIRDARNYYSEHAGNSTLADLALGPLLWDRDRLAGLCRELLAAPANSDEGAGIREKIARALADAEMPAVKEKEKEKAKAKAPERAREPAGAAS